MIRLTNVSKEYTKGVPALYDINLNVKPGEFVFICGESGSGKSTLISLLLKELDPTEGTIEVNGSDLGKMRHRQIPYFRRQIGCVFQDFRLLPESTVYENIAFAQRIIAVPRRKRAANVNEALSVVGLAAKYKSKPAELSGGEQQRVAIARALINKPSLILADEPTGNLDVNNAWEIMRLLEKINDGGATVLVVSHNMEIVEAMHKRVITIQKGRIISDVDANGVETVATQAASEPQPIVEELEPKSEAQAAFEQEKATISEEIMDLDFESLGDMEIEAAAKEFAGEQLPETEVIAPQADVGGQPEAVAEDDIERVVLPEDAKGGEEE